MKYLLLITSFIIGLNVFSQENELPLKKDNTIIVESSDTKKIDFKDFAVFLLDEGLDFSKKDEEYSIIVTEYRNTKSNLNFKWNMRARIKEDKLIITANWKLATATSINVGAGVTTSLNDSSPWHYKKSGVYGKLYAELLELVKGYCSDCPIKYENK